MIRLCSRAGAVRRNAASHSGERWAFWRARPRRRGSILIWRGALIPIDMGPPRPSRSSKGPRAGVRSDLDRIHTLGGAEPTPAAPQAQELVHWRVKLSPSDCAGQAQCGRCALRVVPRGRAGRAAPEQDRERGQGRAQADRTCGGGARRTLAAPQSDHRDCAPGCALEPAWPTRSDRRPPERSIRSRSAPARPSGSDLQRRAIPTVLTSLGGCAGSAT